MKDLIKRFWPTILPVLVLIFSALSPAVADAIQKFAILHPQLGLLIGAVWAAIANWVRAQKPPSA